MTAAVSKITPKYREIARRLLAGERQCDIAMDMGMSESRLSIIVNAPLFRKTMNALQDKVDRAYFDVVGEMRKEAKGAATTILDIMKSPLSTNPERLSAAKEVLRLGGYGPKAGVNVQVNNLSFEQRLSLVEKESINVEGEVYE